MTISKSIRNVQNALDGTVNSAVKAATELAKVPSILRKFELSGVENKATIQDGDDAALKNYVIQLENLDEKSKSAASSLVLLNDAQKKDAADIANLLQSGELLNSQLAQRTLATTSLSEMQQRQIMTEANLIDSSGNYRAELVQQAEANIMNSDAFKALTTSEQLEVIAAIEDTAAKQGQTAATVTLTAAQKALNTSMLIGKQILLGIGVAVLTAAVTTLVKKIAEAIPTYDNLKNKTAETAQAFEDAKQKVSDLESKIADVKKRMDECRDSDSGKIVDQESFTLLEHQKELLETNLRLAQQNREEAAKDANKAVYNQFNGGEYNTDIGKRENIAETVLRNIDAYKSWQKQIDDTTEALQKDGASEQVIADKTALATQMRDNARAVIEKYSGDLTDLSDKLLQNGDDGTQAYQDTVKALTDAENATSNFIDYYDNGIPYITQAVNEFNDSVADGSEKAQALSDAIASGNVMQGSEAYEYAAELAEKYGVSVDGLITKLEELHDAQQDASDSKPDWDVDTTQELADFMSKLSDSSSDLYAKTKALTSAYNDMYQNQKLSSDSIQSLISAYPELISHMETENGVTTISKDILCEKFEAMKSAMVATIESEIQATETAIAQANARIATYQAEIKAITALYSAIGTIDANITVGTAAYEAEMEHLSGAEQKAFERYVAAQSGIKDANKTLDEATSKLEDQKNALDVLNNLTLPNYSGATKGASSANKGAAQAAKEHKKALEAQKKEAEKTQKALEKYSKTLKAQGDAVIDILDKRKDALEKEQKAKDKAWDKEKKQLQDEKDLKDKAWDKEKAALKEQKELQDDIYDKQKNALKEQKELQDKVYQQQINDLKNKKQALQDANDEEDRAIKLAQLQDALEQAKSQRTKRVYQHDTGFEWQTDDSAVSDAQNALDDQKRTWQREDAIAAVEKEIEAVEKLKDAYDEQIESEIDGIDKAKDAYDEKVETQIDAIEKAKDAFDEMIEDRIDQIENAKDAYDEMIESETEKLDEMKEQWQDVMDLIGMSWEDYQAKIAATAQFQNMTLDGMGQYLGGYKDEVIKNMRDIAAAEAEVQRITDELSGLDTSSGSGGGGGGAGGGGVNACGGQKNGYAGLSDNLKKVADTMSENIVKLNDLKAREEELTEQIDTGNLSTQEKTDKYRELSDVQQQITDKEADLNQMSLNYIETLGNETEATDEYRASAISYLQELNTQYGASYDDILEKLQKHIQDLKDTDTGTADVYNSMGKTVQEFKTQVSNYLSGPAGLTNDFQKLQRQVENTATAIIESCNKAVEGLKNLKRANKEEGAGSSAIGTRNSRSGWYHLDESGPEIVVHDGKPSSGRYTYLERGDQVLPASYSKNLWDIGSNPSEWFERQYSKFNRMDNSKVAYAGNSTVYSPSFTGDIIISNPVANSDDLARGLTQNLPASFMQAIGVRM